MNFSTGQNLTKSKRRKLSKAYRKAIENGSIVRTEVYDKYHILPLTGPKGKKNRIQLASVALAFYARNQKAFLPGTIYQLAKACGISHPTLTKLMPSLIHYKIVKHDRFTQTFDEVFTFQSPKFIISEILERKTDQKHLRVCAPKGARNYEQLVQRDKNITWSQMIRRVRENILILNFRQQKHHVERAVSLQQEHEELVRNKTYKKPSAGFKRAYKKGTLDKALNHRTDIVTGAYHSASLTGYSKTTAQKDLASLKMKGAIKTKTNKFKVALPKANTPQGQKFVAKMAVKNGLVQDGKGYIDKSSLFINYVLGTIITELNIDNLTNCFM